MINVKSDCLLHSAYEALIYKEKRFDSREFGEIRDLEIVSLTKNGDVVVKFGKTLVNISVSARIVDLNKISGSSNLIQFNFTGYDDERYNGEYFRSIFNSINVIISDSLVILKGEKAWMLGYNFDILDDDGGVFTAVFAGLLLSLKTIRIPAHTNMGGLIFHPSSRRSHNVISPTTSFIFLTLSAPDPLLFDNEKPLLYDSSLNEALVVKSCIDLVIDSSGYILYFNSTNQRVGFGFLGDLKERCKHLFDVINTVPIPTDDLHTIARPDAYMNYEFPKIEIHKKEIANVKNIEINRIPDEKFTIHTHFLEIAEKKDQKSVQEKSTEKWLQSSLFN